MRFGGLHIFLQKNKGALNFSGITRKTIVIIMTLTKETKNFQVSPVCVQHSGVLRLLLGKISHWTKSLI